MTTEAPIVIFNTPENLSLLRRLLQVLSFIPSDTVEPDGLTVILGQVLELMVGNPEKFDEYASSNAEWIGRSFFREIDRLKINFRIKPDTV